MRKEPGLSLLGSVIAGAAVLLLTACGGGGGTTPPAKQAVSWTAQAGASAQNEALQSLQFYPATITIDAGDSITWSNPAGEPHTVTFLGPKSAPPPPNDPSVQQPAGTSTYDASTYTSSGFMLHGASYTLTFTKPGTYKYYCLIHGDMAGTVVVQAAGSPYPRSAAQIATANTSTIATDLNSISVSVGGFPYTSGGTHLAGGISPGMGAPPFTLGSVMRFLDGPSLNDNSVTIPAGATLTWTNLDSNNPHTVTFPVAGQPVPQMDPFSPPSGASTYDGTALVNSGPLFGGQSFSLTFTKAGTYTYVCLFHDDGENMTGTVVVQ
jgi:plastocyanin